MGFLGNPFVNAALLGPEIYNYGLKPLGDFLRSDRGQLLKDSLGRGDFNRASLAVFGKPITPMNRGLVFKLKHSVLLGKSETTSTPLDKVFLD